MDQVPGLVGVGVIRLCWVFAAVRLAKPRSLWARAYYLDDRLDTANERFPAGCSVRGCSARRGL